MADIEYAKNASPRFERYERDKLYKLWQDPVFRDDIIDRSEDKGEEAYSIGEILENHSPSDQENPSAAVDFLLYNRGFNLYDKQFRVSSRMKSFGGPWREKAYDKRDHKLSDLVLADAHLDMSYWRTLISGRKSKDLGILESVFKNLNQLGGIDAGNVLNPVREGPFFRGKLFGPAIDFRRIVGDIEFITEETYKLNKDTNDDDERRMETYPEGVVPKIMTLEYSDESLTFQRFRGGVRASYDYLNSNQTRIGRIRNAIEEIAIYHRIVLFEMIIEAIWNGLVRSEVADKLTHIDTNLATTSNNLTWIQWRDFTKSFGAFYSPDIMICRSDASTLWESIAMTVPSLKSGGVETTTTTPQATISIGQFATTASNLNQNPYILNNTPIIPEYGWYDSLKNTILDQAGDTHDYLVFDRDRSSVIVFQRGSDQDETEREAGPQIITRYLSTKAGAYCPDVNGVKMLRVGEDTKAFTAV